MYQGHVFTFWDSLAKHEQDSLLEQLSSIDPARVNDIYALAVKQDSASSSASSDEIAPPPPELVDTPVGNLDSEAQWREAGMKAIKEGKVGVILLAGGQGTRLGSSDPKGCYDIGLPSGKSLFQLQAERISRLSTLTGATIPWYIMTSGPTRSATEAFFEKHSYFGLDKMNVTFFNQGRLQSLTSITWLTLSNRRPSMPDERGQDPPRLEVQSCRCARW